MPDLGLRLSRELAMGHSPPYLENKLPEGTEDLTKKLPPGLLLKQSPGPKAKPKRRF